MNELKEKKQNALTSMEVAEMVEKQHSELLKDIRRYTAQLNEVNLPYVEFFAESTYKDSKGEIRPCYNVSKKGCEFISNKLTGVKGAKFTAQYINRFHDMEDYIKENIINDLQSGKFLMCLQGVKFLADDLRVAESSRILMYNGTFREFGLPTTFLPKYEDNGNRERCSATELLKRNNCGMSANKFNQFLISDGYMEIKERKSSKGTKTYKSLTDKGIKYGVNLVSEKNQNETQAHYYADTFMELFNFITQDKIEVS